jgi:hypothetical protein
MNKITIAKDTVLLLFILLVCVFIYNQIEINKSSEYNNIFIKDRDYYYTSIEEIKKNIVNCK